MATTVNRNVPDYTTGTVSGTSGTAVITGIGTAWTSIDANGNVVANVYPNDMFICGTQMIPIKSVDNALQITLHFNLVSTISPGTTYKILRYTPAPTGTVLGTLQQLLAQGTDASPIASYAVDNGAAREKLRISGAGHPQLAVGASGAADGALLGAIDIDPATGIVLFPYGIDPTEPESTVASATTTDLGSVNTMKVAISGTTTITSFGTRAHAIRFIRFTGALTLTYNATSLILPGAANITTAANDCAIATSDASGNWRVRHYQRAAFAPAPSTYAVGDIPYASAATALSALADVATGNVLRSGGVGVAPAYGKVNLGTDVTSTLPVVNGGTGDTGTAWTAYTPTLSAGSGTFTTASATGIWKSIGKTVFFQVTITITTNGTAAGFVAATLPISAATAFISFGRETTLTGKGLVSTIFGGGVSASYYDNTYPGGNGASIIVCGIYQST